MTVASFGVVEMAAFDREVDENRKRLTRSELDALAKQRAKDRIAELRSALPTIPKLEPEAELQSKEAGA